MPALSKRDWVRLLWQLFGKFCSFLRGKVTQTVQQHEKTPTDTVLNEKRCYGMYTQMTTATKGVGEQLRLARNSKMLQSLGQ